MGIWLEIITQYGTLGLLVIILYIVVRGNLISKKTVDSIKNTYETAMTQTRMTYEKTLDRICKSHEDELKNITVAFEKQIDSLKDIIKIFKKRNGIK